MRVFQNSGVASDYLAAHQRECNGATFAARIARFLDDCYGAVHILGPVLDREEFAFFTNGDDEALQRTWAREMGMPPESDMTEILLAQIEHHRTEVFYNLDPVRYGSDFVRKLPGCVRRSIAWRAAPSTGADFGEYDSVVCNFPGILKSYEACGWKAAYFFPSYDPRMGEYAINDDRPIDVLFIGGYSRHHSKRAAILQAVASLRSRYRIEFRLAPSRFTKLAESPLGRLAPLGKYRRPKDIRAVSRGPVFGRDLYGLIAKSKIVLNGSVDMAGEDRGNMRCFEALGCRALMVSDSGQYPDGMQPDRTMKTYHNGAEAISTIESSLEGYEQARLIADRGYSMIRSLYSKAAQWSAFQNLVGAL